MYRQISEDRVSLAQDASCMKRGATVVGCIDGDYWIGVSFRPGEWSPARRCNRPSDFTYVGMEVPNGFDGR